MKNLKKCIATRINKFLADHSKFLIFVEVFLLSIFIQSYFIDKWQWVIIYLVVYAFLMSTIFPIFSYIFPVLKVIKDRKYISTTSLFLYIIFMGTLFYDYYCIFPWKIALFLMFYVLLIGIVWSFLLKLTIPNDLGVFQKISLLLSFIGCLPILFNLMLRDILLEMQALEYLNNFNNFDVKSIHCFHDRLMYSNISKFIEEIDGIPIAFFGPKGVGKSTFFKKFSAEHKGVIYYSIEKKDIDDKRPFQNLVDSMFFTVFWNSPISIFFSLTRTTTSLIYDKPDFVFMINFFQSVDFMKKIIFKTGSKPIFILDNSNILKKNSESAKETFNALINFMKISHDTRFFKVILSGSEGWTPQVLTQSLGYRFLAKNFDSDLTKNETKNFYLCLNKGSEKYFQQIYEIIKGNILHHQMFSILLAKNSINVAIDIMLDVNREEFLKAGIDFDVFFQKNKNLKFSKHEITNLLTLFYLLIKENGRIRVNKTNSYLIIPKITKLNVIKHYSEDGIYYVDFQTQLHRYYVEVEMGFKGNKNTYKEFSRAITQKYNFSLEPK